MQLEQHYRRIADQGVQLYAVSVDPPEVSAALRRRLGVDFTFLSDERGSLLDALHIRHRAGGRDGADIAFPTTVLVDAGGTVRWTFESDTFRERARPEDVFEAVRRLGGGAGSDGAH